MTTKITLTNIDSTGDYSELVDAAYNTANSASSYANSAYAAANTKLDSSGGTISGNITITGNIVPTTANTYYLGSEASPFHSLFVGSGSISIGGLVLSNSNGSLGVTSPTGPSLDFTAISSTANAAYTRANTTTTNAATADQRAVTSGVYANSAYTRANTATTNAATADQRAVTSGVYANSAYTQANTNSKVAQSGSNKTSSYTLTTADIGKFVGVGSSGSIVIPNATFATGDAITIFNDTSASITITCSITTAYISGTNTDKASVTLATRGLATVLFVSSTVCVIAGSVT